MPNLSFVGATAGGDNTRTVNNVNAALPAGTQSGHLQSIWVSCGVLSPATPPAINTPSGWTSQGSSGTILLAGVLNVVGTLFTKIAGGTEGTENLATSGGTNAAIVFVRKSYRYPDQTTPFAQLSWIGGTGGSDTSPIVTGITTGANNAMIDIYVTQGAAQSITPPATMIERADNSTVAVSSADEIIPTAGATGSRTFTLPAATTYMWGIAEFRSEIDIVSTPIFYLRA